jgi:uncharacterized protein YqeY
MSLLQQLKDDQLGARKGKEAIKASILTTLIGESAIIGKNNGNRESTDEEVIAVIKKFIKNINETLKVSESADLQSERDILSMYLPVQMTDDALRAVVSDLIKELNQPSMGNVMKCLKERYNGLYDGKTASSIIKELT